MFIITFTLYTEPVLTFSPRHQQELAVIVQTGVPDVIVAAAELGDEETLRNYLNKNPHEVLTGVRRIFALAKQKNSNQLRPHNYYKPLDMPNKEHFTLFSSWCKILLSPVAYQRF